MQLVKFSPCRSYNLGVELMGQSGSANDDSPVAEAELSPLSVHLLCTAQSNTLALSQMADGKANILIGATFVVFSLVITQTFSETVKWSVICLAVTAFLSAICAVLAITPPLRSKPVAVEHTNPLFFGHFALIEEQRWADDMLEKLRSDEALFRVMLHDLYQNGIVLQRRKYRYLALAYNIFLGGLALTLGVYLIENVL